MLGTRYIAGWVAYTAFKIHRMICHMRYTKAGSSVRDTMYSYSRL